MQSYPVKPGHAAKVNLADSFDAYGSMPSIKVRYEGKKELQVDTLSDKSFAMKVAAGDKAALEVAMDTQRRWNDFLEGVTGYDAKTRGKKAQEAAKKSA